MAAKLNLTALKKIYILHLVIFNCIKYPVDLTGFYCITINFKKFFFSLICIKFVAFAENSLNRFGLLFNCSDCRDYVVRSFLKENSII